MAATQDKEGLAVEVAGLRTKVSSLQLDLDNSVAVQNDLRAAVAVAAGGAGEDPAAGEGGAVAARGGRGGVRRLQTGVLRHQEEASPQPLRQDILF